MTAAKVTSKGQITIPSNVRAELKVRPGDRVEFVNVSGGHWELVAAVEDVRRLRGIVVSKRVVSIEEMDSAIRHIVG